MSQSRNSRSWLAATVVGGLLVMTAMVVKPAAAARWIVDETTGCGTSNPFPAADESIRWYGACVNGMLQGEGTLIWYRAGLEVERNKGTFLDGELHGEAITSYPDGRTIAGRYRNGERHGVFLVTQTGGGQVRALYERGRLMSQATVNGGETGGGSDRQPVAAAPAIAIPRPPAAVAAQPAPVYAAPAPAPVLNPANPPLPVVQPGYVKPAVLLRYSDNIDAGQLFRSLFASSGRNAVAPAGGVTAGQ